jgi:hypothetical protein
MQIKSKLELRITKAIQNKDRNKLDDILVKEKLTKENYLNAIKDCMEERNIEFGSIFINRNPFLELYIEEFHTLIYRNLFFEDQVPFIQQMIPKLFTFRFPELIQKEIYHFFLFLSRMECLPRRNRETILETLISLWNTIDSFKTENHSILKWFLYKYLDREYRKVAAYPLDVVKRIADIVQKNLNLLLYPKVYYLLSRFYSIQKLFDESEIFFKLAVEESWNLFEKSKTDNDLDFYKSKSLENKLGTYYEKLESDNKPIIIVEEQSNGDYAIRLNQNETLIAVNRDNRIEIRNMELKLLAVLKGHTDYVFEFEFSPDGRTIVTGSHDNTIKLWTIDGKLLHTFYGHDSFVKKIQFFQEGKKNLSSGFDWSIKAWDIEGELLFTVGDYIGFGCGDNLLALSHQEEFFAVDTKNLYDLKGNCFYSLPIDFSIDALALSPDSRCIAFATQDYDNGECEVRIIDLEGKLIQILRNDIRNYKIEKLFYSPDGKFLASMGRDSCVSVW